MKTAILVDQRFVVLSTLGIIVATMYKGEPNSIHFKKIIFPPFVVVACLMNVFNFDFQEWIQFILQKVGSGVTPLALFQLVFNCVLKAEVNIGSFGAWAAVYKLILTPAEFICCDFESKF
jgi:hypothetical protein